ncbi:MAG: hypothetical protein EA397_18855 [Deltaproteobacteria bacterium]|nr:MAG: hypothetical protein EA397_18855 [Deltaproteobacteria bacterium]
MRQPLNIALAAALALSGCYPFVSGSRFEDRLCELDEDGDGNEKCDHIGPDGELVSGDCDDSDPLRSFLNEEIPYDGIDNNCSGSDIVDYDEDGFPGIDREEYEALDGLPWPTGMSELVDCDDEDPTIYPGATEIWYDGIDQNCDGLCDFDADQDGFADRRQGQDNDCEIPATDCLDTDPNIYPGAPGEVYYDGEDQNCDGVNDFDPDQDGYAWAGYEAANQTFLERYGYDDTIVAFTECYDVDDSPLRVGGEIVDPADVFPGQDEVWYNGIDDDCSDLHGEITNDFDQDGDGFMPTAMREDFIAYVRQYVEYQRHDDSQPLRAKFIDRFGPDEEAWASYFDRHDNDCDDEDPTIFPGALERLGDGVDRNCNGNPDTAEVVRGPFDMAGFADLRLNANPDHFIMVASFLETTRFGSGSPTGPRVVGLSWDQDLGPDDEAVVDSRPFDANDADRTLLPAVSLLPREDGYFTGVPTFNATQNSAWLLKSEPNSAININYRMTLQNPGIISWTETIESEHIETVYRRDETGAWSVVCGNHMFARVSYDILVTSSNSFAIEASDVLDCFITVSDEDVPTFYGVFEDGIDAWRLDSNGDLIAHEEHAFDGVTATFARNHNHHLLLGQEEGLLIQLDTGDDPFTVLEEHTVTFADATYYEGLVYVAAVVEGTEGPETVLTYGEPGDTLSVHSFPFEHDGELIEPTAVGIEAAGDRVLLLIHGVDAAGDEHLGWVPLEI